MAEESADDVDWESADETVEQGSAEANREEEQRKEQKNRPKKVLRKKTHKRKRTEKQEACGPGKPQEEIKLVLENMTLQAVEVSKAISSDSVAAHVIAFLEEEHPLVMKKYCPSGNQSTLLALMQWFRRHFSVADRSSSESLFSESLTPESLNYIMQNCQQGVCVGSSLQLCFIFHSILSVLGYCSRLIYCFDKALRTAKNAKKTKKARRVFDDWNSGSDEDNEGDENGSMSSSHVDKVSLCEVIEFQRENSFAVAWVEVAAPSKKSNLDVEIVNEAKSPSEWVNIDPVRNICDCKVSVENAISPHRVSVSYIVAISISAVNGKVACFVEDVTNCYSSKLNRTRSKRLNCKDGLSWWEMFLSGISESQIQSKTSSQRPLDVLPTSTDGFKNHPYYLLKSHLRPCQVLSTGAKPVGLFSGQPIYSRSDVIELKTKYEWRVLNKRVCPDEVPFESKSNARTSYGRCDAHPSKELYAEWQTEKMPRPELIDGKIPVNEYGNIEIWDGNEALVPSGARYIGHKYASKAADTLSIPHVDAVVGFKDRNVYKSGLSQIQRVPVLMGVVVLEGYADIILDAIAAMEEKFEADEREVRWIAASKKWRRLTEAMLLRHRLRVDYGH